jgi:hypothetical protein
LKLQEGVDGPALLLLRLVLHLSGGVEDTGLVGCHAHHTVDF